MIPFLTLFLHHPVLWLRSHLGDEFASELRDYRLIAAHKETLEEGGFLKRYVPHFDQIYISSKNTTHFM
jgi:hypothetical protein